MHYTLRDVYAMTGTPSVDRQAADVVPREDLAALQRRRDTAMRNMQGVERGLASGLDDLDVLQMAVEALHQIIPDADEWYTSCRISIGERMRHSWQGQTSLLRSETIDRGRDCLQELQERKLTGILKKAGEMSRGLSRGISMLTDLEDDIEALLKIPLDDDLEQDA